MNQQLIAFLVSMGLNIFLLICLLRQLEQISRLEMIANRAQSIRRLIKDMKEIEERIYDRDR